MLVAEGVFQLTVGVVRVRVACARRSPTDTYGRALLEFTSYFSWVMIEPR
jgi:hypothetical protein